MPVGMCPTGMKRDGAEQALNDGIKRAGRRKRSPFPQDVYNVINGIPYRAHPSGRGARYHGFPEVIQKIPVDVRQELRERAEQEGDLEAYESWESQHGDDDA